MIDLLELVILKNKTPKFFLKLMLSCVILLIIFIIIGIYTDIIFIPIAITLISLTIGGIIGGKWLWKKLASSDIFKSGVPIYIKIIGCIFLIGLIVFVALGFIILFTGDATLIREIVQQSMMLLLFGTLYNAGYLLSIWKPTPIPNDASLQTFKLQKKKIVLVGIITSVYVLTCFLLAFVLTETLISIYFLYLTFAGIGFSMGWIFWEHLKETRVLSGNFLTNLKLLSVGFELALVALTILNLVANSLNIPIIDRFALLSLLLLLYLSIAYFIGLTSEIIRK